MGVHMTWTIHKYMQYLSDHNASMKSMYSAHIYFIP